MLAGDMVAPPKTMPAYVSRPLSPGTEEEAREVGTSRDRPGHREPMEPDPTLAGTSGLRQRAVSGTWRPTHHQPEGLETILFFKRS